MLRVALVVAAVAIALAACSASQAGIVPPSATASVTIRIPHPVAGATNRRRLYIASTTESVSLKATSTTTHATVLATTFNVTSTSNGCTTTLSVTTCMESFALPPDSYTATVITYDGLSGAGNALSSAQLVPFIVQQGVANSVPLTLYGVPASMAITAGSSTTRGTQAAGFTIYGSSAQSFTITAKDADGATIVGAGAPTWSVIDASGSGFTIVGPTGSANAFTLTATGNVTESVTVANADTDASVCAQSDAVCSATISATRQQLLFYIDSSGTVRSLAPPYTGTPTSVLTGVSIGQLSAWVATDSFGNLFVSQGSGTCETRVLAPPYTAVTTTITACANQICVDAAGDIFVSGREYQPPYTSYTSTVFSADDIYAISGSTIAAASSGSETTVALPPYATPEADLTPGPNTGHTSLGVDTAGDVFSANQSANAVDVFFAPLPSAPVAISVPGANELVLDHAGNLFVNSASSIYEFKPPFSSSSTASTIFGTTGASRMIVNANNDLFVSQGGVYEYIPPFTASPSPIGSPETTSPIALTP